MRILIRLGVVAPIMLLAFALVSIWLAIGFLRDSVASAAG